MKSLCRELLSILDTVLTPGLAIGLTSIWVGLWWSASFARWEKLISFNYYNEAIAEGVLMHLILGWYLWLGVRYGWRLVRKLRE